MVSNKIINLDCLVSQLHIMARGESHKVSVKYLKAIRYQKRAQLTGTKVLTGCPVLLATLKLFDWAAQTAFI